jgi:hypothetical protein
MVSMKSYFSVLLISVLLACSKHDEPPATQSLLKVDQQTLNFNDSVTTLTIGLHAFGSWTITITPDTSLLSLSAFSGTGSTTITVSTKNLNTTGNDLTSTIHIALNDSSASADVTAIMGTVNESLLHVFGGEGNDVFNDVYYDNGESILVGYSESTEGDVDGNKGGKDLWIVKVNVTGQKIWHHTYGGSGDDVGKVVYSLFDGTFLIAGETNSTDGDVTQALGGRDVWLLRIDADGNIISQKTIGGTGDDGITSLEQSLYGGYIFSGVTNGDQWYGVIDNNLDISWQKTFGSSGQDFAGSISSSPDGYIFSGYGSTQDGDVADKPTASPDVWIVNTDASGNVRWKQYISGSNEETTIGATYAQNGSYLVAGTTNSPDSFPDFQGTKNIFIANYSTSGDLNWKKTIRQSAFDEPSGFAMTKFTDPVIVGKTLHPGSAESENNTDAAIWVIDATTGIVIRTQIIGANAPDGASAMDRGSSGEYTIAGFTSSYPDANGHVQTNSGGWFYIWKYP